MFRSKINFCLCFTRDFIAIITFNRTYPTSQLLSVFIHFYIRLLTNETNKTDRNTSITVSCHFMQMSTSSKGHASVLWLVYFCLCSILKMNALFLHYWLNLHSRGYTNTSNKENQPAFTRKYIALSSLFLFRSYLLKEIPCTVMLWL